ncbi:MAG: D-aminoacyl-tRNA deacylase [Candidatus Thermoplasmatota archaeon]|jgi:D-aminoacyl-tRNA deacylase|nr:D-aminoacyl-tRNA deacylase [Candidatus Thermoplasmatota archaeon]MCL5963262.1 D-aminoacyl-tRNA deacylase [Candidatus Thermoplasmatota archaeon]
MISIIIDENDPVATAVFTILQETEHFKLYTERYGYTIYKGDNILAAVSEQQHLYMEHVDEIFSDINIDTVIFPSIHKSQKETRSFTVHPVGNYGINSFGGVKGKLSRSSPVYMYYALRYLYHHRLPNFTVSYEATHHGPYTDLPSFFIETGSSSEEWNNHDSHVLIADVIKSLYGNIDVNIPVSIGIGGGHYAPRFTDYSIKHGYAFGHILPAYQFENFVEDVGRQMLEKTPTARYMALQGNVPATIRQYFEKYLKEII